MNRQLATAVYNREPGKETNACSARPKAIYEELLALRCRRGELFYFIRRLVDNEADAWDILQETWVRVLSGILSLREPGSLGSWLYRITRNAAFNHGQLRATYRQLLENYPAAAAEDDDPGREEFENAEQVHHVQATIALFTGLVLLVGAGVMMVMARVQQAELRTQEALLRLEYRMAQMSENQANAS